MTNFGEHYNEELAQQEIEINKKTLREMVGAFIVLTAVWGAGVWTFSDSKCDCVQCDVCNFRRLFYYVCDLIL